MDFGALKELAVYGPTVVLFGLIFYFVLRALPTWKEVRLAELKFRDDDLRVRTQQLEVLKGITETLKDVVDVYGKQSELIGIAQRSASERSNRMEEVLQNVVQRVRAIEDQIKYGAADRPTVEIQR